MVKAIPTQTRTKITIESWKTSWNGVRNAMWNSTKRRWNSGATKFLTLVKGLKPHSGDVVRVNLSPDSLKQEGTSQGQGRGQELRGRNRRRQKISTQSHSPKEIKWDLQHSPTGGEVVIWLCSSSVNSQPSGLRHPTYRSCRWSVASRTSSNSYHRSAWKFQWGSYYTAKWQSLPHPARPWDQATEASKRLCLDRDIKQCLSLNLI